LCFNPYVTYAKATRAGKSLVKREFRGNAGNTERDLFSRKTRGPKAKQDSFGGLERYRRKAKGRELEGDPEDNVNHLKKKPQNG